ncbi:MAG: fold metallo-hydrolase [Solirubrobacterales bacterium]|nr:fold metallo-hydrolase [Solirubrobacterales bacterium]
MPAPAHKREVGRGERVLPGVWRLRLPLPWPGVPHCNAWAVAAGDGIVLFDTGMHEPGSLAHLERALAQVHLKLEHVRLLVCTHAHSDHYGQAATIVERSGCELWMHPAHQHQTQYGEDPEGGLERRLEIARQSGVPAAPLAAYQDAAKGRGSGVKGIVLPDRPLVDGVRIGTDLGDWEVVETPGHAPSHVCLHQPERRLLISGDHLLGRISLYYEHGWSPDPVGEFLASLDRVAALDVRLCLSGHGRTFTDVEAHIEANRKLVAEDLERHLHALEGGALTAFDVVPRVHDDAVTELNASWWLTETLCYLEHLEIAGRVRRVPAEDDGPERWAAT